MKIITKDSLQRMIDEASTEKKKYIVGRALVVVFNNQTRDEQSINNTTINNGVGFTGADARSGTLTAKSFLKNKTLTDWQLNAWLRKDSSGYSRICKYHNQLEKAAQQKAAR